jgi:surfeit locus 1 family protein
MRYKKAPTLAYLCLLPLLISLGFWQLGRSEEKRVILEKQEQGISSPEFIRLSASGKYNVDEFRYQKVRAIGHYDREHQFLLDNQIRNGKVGYFVFTPFIFEEESQAVLVNRGWVPLNHDRSNLPEIMIKSQQAEVQGRINRFPGVGIKLAGAEIPTQGWPSIVQVINNQVLTDKLGYKIFPFQIELAKELPEGYDREWQITTIMLPEQHTAYAIQWFALAFTLTLLYLWYSYKKSDE